MFENGLLYKKRAEHWMKNWRLISITSCVYRSFTDMITHWIQNQHATNRLTIFSRCQKGFVQGQAGCMEHAVLTREMISHATLHKKDLYMAQIDFSNAFGSILHDLILGNMASLGLPQVTINLVQNIYTNNRWKMTLTGGETEYIPWQSRTVQGRHLSPTLFNICLEGFLRPLEKDDMKVLGHCIPIQDGSAVQINSAAYVEDSFLCSDTHKNMERMLILMAFCCAHAKMKINVEKCVSISQMWSPFKKNQADCDPEPFFIHTILATTESRWRLCRSILACRLDSTNTRTLPRTNGTGVDYGGCEEH
jgi:hypothetical protein